MTSTTSRVRTLTLAGALVAAAAAPAAAFPTGSQFDEDALTKDGGGGLAFAGGPLDAGHSCGVCHVGAPGRIGLRLEADQIALFSDGYTPGATYRMRVVLEHEWAAKEAAAAGDNCGDGTTPYQRCDENGMAVELTSTSGAPAGTLAAAGATCGGTPSDPDVRVLDSGAGLTYSGTHAGLTAWSFCWTAPVAGTGAVTAFLAAVDGGGGDGTMANPEDAAGDDVFAGSVGIAELGRGPRVQGGGCSAGGSAGWAAGVLLALGAIALARPRRRALAATTAALVLASAAGCATVKPHEKQDLAKRKMVFAPDATEDQLDLHMQESREGSAGGYGTAGGGCGCN